MKRYFYLKHTVRYDECSNAQCLTPAAFVRYMQDLAARDAEDAQLSGNGYWVVRRTIMDLATPILLHTPLVLRTYGIGFTRITAQRGYEAYTDEETLGKPLISARTLWVYVDPQGRPTRLPEKTGQIWLPDGPLPPQEEEPFPPVPASEPARLAATVRFSEIDLASHLNNASAVELLDNAGWEACAAAGILPTTATMDALFYDLEYLDSPRFGDTLDVSTWLDPFPVPGQPCWRYQEITRAGKRVVRSRSRWLWHTE